jgi:hypothetical protein
MDIKEILKKSRIEGYISFNKQKIPPESFNYNTSNSQLLINPYYEKISGIYDISKTSDLTIENLINDKIVKSGAFSTGYKYGNITNNYKIVLGYEEFLRIIKFNLDIDILDNTENSFSYKLHGLNESDIEVLLSENTLNLSSNYEIYIENPIICKELSLTINNPNGYYEYDMYTNYNIENSYIYLDSNIDYQIIQFNNSNTIIFDNYVYTDILLVGGGGGGGMSIGSGGGSGGEVKLLKNILLYQNINYNISIGSGGTIGNIGEDTEFHIYKVIGGNPGNSLNNIIQEYRKIYNIYTYNEKNIKTLIIGSNLPVKELKIHLWGASGGDAIYNVESLKQLNNSVEDDIAIGNGGKGGYTSFKLNGLKEGDELNLIMGQKGMDGTFLMNNLESWPNGGIGGLYTNNINELDEVYYPTAYELENSTYTANGITYTITSSWPVHSGNLVNLSYYEDRNINYVLFDFYRNYDSTNTNRPSTISSGNTYRGEWIQWHFSNPIIISKYMIKKRGDSYDSPNIVSLHGSKDGINWVVLDDDGTHLVFFDNKTNKLGKGRDIVGGREFIINITNDNKNDYYYYFRLIIHGLSTSSSYCYLSAFIIIGNEYIGGGGGGGGRTQISLNDSTGSDITKIIGISGGGGGGACSGTLTDIVNGENVGNIGHKIYTNLTFPSYEKEPEYNEVFKVTNNVNISTLSIIIDDNSIRRVNNDYYYYEYREGKFYKNDTFLFRHSEKYYPIWHNNYFLHTFINMIINQDYIYFYNQTYKQSTYERKRYIGRYSISEKSYVDLKVYNNYDAIYQFTVNSDNTKLYYNNDSTHISFINFNDNTEISCDLPINQNLYGNYYIYKMEIINNSLYYLYTNQYSDNFECKLCKMILDNTKNDIDHLTYNTSYTSEEYSLNPNGDYSESFYIYNGNVISNRIVFVGFTLSSDENTLFAYSTDNKLYIIDRHESQKFFIEYTINNETTSENYIERCVLYISNIGTNVKNYFIFNENGNIEFIKKKSGNNVDIYELLNPLDIYRIRLYRNIQKQSEFNVIAYNGIETTDIDYITDSNLIKYPTIISGSQLQGGSCTSNQLFSGGGGDGWIGGSTGFTVYHDVPQSNNEMLVRSGGGSGSSYINNSLSISEQIIEDWYYGCNFLFSNIENYTGNGYIIIEYDDIFFTYSNGINKGGDLLTAFGGLSNNYEKYEGLYKSLSGGGGASYYSINDDIYSINGYNNGLGGDGYEYLSIKYGEGGKGHSCNIDEIDSSIIELNSNNGKGGNGLYGNGNDGTIIMKIYTKTIIQSPKILINNLTYYTDGYKSIPIQVNYKNYNYNTDILSIKNEKVLIGDSSCNIDNCKLYVKGDVKFTGISNANNYYWHKDDNNGYKLFNTKGQYLLRKEDIIYNNDITELNIHIWGGGGSGYVSSDNFMNINNNGEYSNIMLSIDELPFEITVGEGGKINSEEIIYNLQLYYIDKNTNIGKINTSYEASLLYKYNFESNVISNDTKLYSPSHIIYDDINYYSGKSCIKFDKNYYLYNNNIKFNENQKTILFKSKYNTLFTNKPAYAIYSAENFNDNILYDSSGNERHSTSTNGIITKIYENKICYIYGDTSANITFADDTIKNNFTICSITKYNGTNKKRILTNSFGQGESGDFSHGHIVERKGRAYYKESKYEGPNLGNQEDWLVMCGKNESENTNEDIIVDGIPRESTNKGSGNCTLGINILSSQTSDWAFSQCFIWDQHLTYEEMMDISELLIMYLKNEIDIVNIKLLNEISFSLSFFIKNEKTKLDNKYVNLFIEKPPYIIYSAENFNNNILYDSSGNERHSTSTNGTITKIYENNICYIYGGVNDNIILADKSVPINFTICSITKYNGLNRGRILNSTSLNFLHGHHGSRRGVAYYGNEDVNQWKSEVLNIGIIDDWLVMCGKNETTDSRDLLVDGISKGVAKKGKGDCILAINKGIHNERSDWAFSQCFIWNQHLTHSEMRNMSELLLYYLNNQIDIVNLKFIENLPELTYFDYLNNAFNSKYKALFVNKPAYAIYSAENYSTYLFDSSGNEYKPTLPSGTITKKYENNLCYIYGDTSANITFEGGTVSTDFTICSLTKYNGDNKGRILTTNNTYNFSHGHHGNKRGVAYYNNEWKTEELNVGNVDDWLIMCGKNERYIGDVDYEKDILVDGIASGIGIFKGATQHPNIIHDNGSVSATNIGGTNYYYYSFTSTLGTNTIEFLEDTVCDILIVGGGGGGGNPTENGGYEEGGGGAGAFLYLQNVILNGTYNITVGAGGAASTKGGDSKINKTTDIYVCEGGGYGGSDGSGGSGGSGGGGSHYNGGGSANDPTKGNNGASGSSNNGIHQGGGGGGAGSAGNFKDGGSGLANNITGVLLYYAGGGGGCGASSKGYGGNGGGGNGSGGGGSSANAGVNGRGGGGGGGYYRGISGGSGGSGIVIIRYKLQEGNISQSLGINLHEHELSDWAFSQCFIWDQHLTDDEMMDMSDLLTSYLYGDVDINSLTLLHKNEYLDTKQELISFNYFDKLFREKPPIAIYSAENYDTEDPKYKFLDSSGNDRHIINGHVANSINITKTNGKFTYISGDINTHIQFAVNDLRSINNNFTICSITKYNGTYKKRIITTTYNDSKPNDFFHGHHQGRRGVAYYEEWKTDSITVGNNVNEWLVMCGKNESGSINDILVDGLPNAKQNKKGSSVAIGRGGLGINLHEPSDWAFSQCFIWNQHLTDSEMKNMSDLLTMYLNNKIDDINIIGKTNNYIGLYNINNKLVIDINTSNIVTNNNISESSSIWKHITLNLNNDIVVLYIDGKLENTIDISNYSFDINALSNIKIGDYNITKDTLIDDLRIYNYGLTSNIIDNIINKYEIPLQFSKITNNNNFTISFEINTNNIDIYNEIICFKSERNDYLNINIENSNLNIIFGFEDNSNIYNADITNIELDYVFLLYTHGEGFDFYNKKDDIINKIDIIGNNIVDIYNEIIEIDEIIIGDNCSNVRLYDNIVIYNLIKDNLTTSFDNNIINTGFINGSTGTQSFIKTKNNKTFVINGGLSYNRFNITNGEGYDYYTINEHTLNIGKGGLNNIVNGYDGGLNNIINNDIVNGYDGGFYIEFKLIDYYTNEHSTYINNTFKCKNLSIVKQPIDFYKNIRNISKEKFYPDDHYHYIEIDNVKNKTISLDVSFTGHHFVKTIESNIIPGYIVNSIGKYQDIDSYYNSDNINRNIGISQALPIVEYTKKEKEKKCIGVINYIENKSDYRNGGYDGIMSYFKKQGDERLVINSIGEGCIWVSNYNGPLENGDFITSSPIPGIGMKQDEIQLKNYTVGKITMDCDFNPELIEKRIAKQEYKSINYKGKTINYFDNILDINDNIIYETTNEYIPQYLIKYIDINGNIINESEYNSNIHYIMAFVGCIYHCG